VELIVVLALALVWQCARPLGHGLRLVVLGRARRRVADGPGVGWLSPWPPAAACVLPELPLHFDAEGRACAGFGAGSLLSPWRGQAAPARALEAKGELEAAVRGARLDIAGAPWLTAANPRSARALLASLARVRGLPSSERRAAWHAEVEASQDGDALDRWRAAERATRPLGLACAVYVLLVFAVAPLAVIAIGEEPALLRLAPAALLVHLWSCGALLYALSKIAPPLEDRAELTIAAVLYPPALWSARQQILCDVAPWLDGTQAEVTLAHERDRVAVAARALARAEHGGTAARAQVVRRALARLGVLETAESWTPAPVAGASAYCPLCEAAYRECRSVCSDCGIPTRPFERAVPEPPAKASDQS
jgi:hypothetical protein